ncbi:hypothetical protein [Emticicia agri]|uniref:Lipoprotein n=1 Tax=Emticicia agri TaxID=2492393 RepID=A0A4Q5M228_9BACT|nr:hypothetical protein [Emticicia agri]RYU95903.1 hypothetical protein EWM59_09790 [Emticicia agri]
MKIATAFLMTLLHLSCIDTKPIFSIKEDYPRDEIKATHKKVAVLPVNYVTNADSENALEKMMDSNTDPLARQEEKAHKYQQMIYEELSIANKQTDWLTAQATNNILKEKNINFQDIRQLSKSEIAKQLQVDAVIYFDFFFKTEAVSQTDAKSILLTNDDKKTVVEFTVEIYSAIEDNLIWKAKSTMSRQKIYSPTLFRELIGRQLEPVLPFN